MGFGCSLLKLREPSQTMPFAVSCTGVCIHSCHVWMAHGRRSIFAPRMLCGCASIFYLVRNPHPCLMAHSALFRVKPSLSGCIRTSQLEAHLTTCCTASVFSSYSSSSAGDKSGCSEGNSCKSLQDHCDFSHSCVHVFAGERSCLRLVSACKSLP